MGSALDLCASHREETVRESPKLCAIDRKGSTIDELKLKSLFPIEEIYKRPKKRRWKKPRVKKFKNNNK